MDLQNELKDYANSEQITIGSERHLGDGGKKKSLTLIDQSPRQKY